MLGEDAESLIEFYGVTESGNFEGRNILHRAGGAAAPEPEGLPNARRALYEARAQRTWPGLDDKRLTSWNALAIAALAEAGAVLGRDDYLDAARTCADFVLDLAARRGRASPAHLQGRRGPSQRLSGGPRVPARGAADALRGDLRAALVRAGPMPRRHDDRPLRRFRAGRLLLHLRRPRDADRPPQGDRRPPDPLRQLLGCPGTAAAGRADRRPLLRRPSARRPAALRQGSAAPARRLRPPAPRPRLPARPNQGGRPR